MRVLQHPAIGMEDIGTRDRVRTVCLRCRSEALAAPLTTSDGRSGDRIETLTRLWHSL